MTTVDGVYAYRTASGARWRYVVRRSDGTQTTKRGFLSEKAARDARRRVVEQIESLLRSRENDGPALRFEFGALSLDLANLCVRHGERSGALGPTEARLLRFFMGAPDRVFSRGFAYAAGR